MSVVSLRELVVTGASGGVALGRNSEDVMRSLGKPSDRSQIRPEILKYGPLELTFREGKVVLVAYYDSAEEDPRVHVDLPQSRDQLEDLLKEAGTELKEEPALSYDDQFACAAARSGAIVLFKGGRLSSVQLGGAPAESTEPLRRERNGSRRRQRTGQLGEDRQVG